MDAYLEQALVPYEERASVRREIAFTAADGFPLAATLFAPRPFAARSGRPRAVIINSAMGVPRRYYAAFARFLAASGFHVFTYDYRGIGESRSPGAPEGGAPASPHSAPRPRLRLRDWGEKDLAAALDWVKSELRVAHPLVVGHSVGGQIVGLAANNARVRKLLLVGAQSGDWRLWPRASRARVFAFWYGIVSPVTSVLGYLPGRVLGGEPVPGGVAREWARWARRRGYMVGGADGARATGYARLTAPIFAYSFADDDFAPSRAVEALLELYRGARKTHRHVDAAQLGLRSIGHFGFFRESQRDRLWTEARDWLAASPESEPS
jgi:predicted alpha/beta hydrolase